MCNNFNELSSGKFYDKKGCFKGSSHSLYRMFRWARPGSSKMYSPKMQAFPI
jgi:hypothetical protein